MDSAMNYNWILMALLLIPVIIEIVEVIKRPMLTNVLRLICVPVAFIITYVLQMIGLLPLLADKATLLLKLAEKVEGIKGIAGLVNAVISTFSTPVIFAAVFDTLLAFFRYFHANYIAKYLERKFNKEDAVMHERALKRERKIAEEIIKEAQEEAHKQLESISLESAVLEAHAKNGEGAEKVEKIEAPKAPEQQDASELAKQIVTRKQKLIKASKFFNEPSEKKAISLIAGALGGMLIFCVNAMPLFYGMTYMEAVTDGIRNSDATDSAVYQYVDILDEHVVKPYKGTFVVELYDSLGLIDLMNASIRAGGRIEITGGEVIYADDLMKKFVTHAVSAAVEATAKEPDIEKLNNDLGVLMADPVLLSIYADGIMGIIQIIPIPEPDESNMFGALGNNILEHYKTIEKQDIMDDIVTGSDVIIYVVDEGLLGDVFTKDKPVEAFLEDEEKMKGLFGTISGLSVYGPLMDGIFDIGIDMLGTTLGIPATNAEAYDIFINHLLESATSANGSSLDVTAMKSFVKGCAASEDKKVGSYTVVDPDGAEALLAYMSHWRTVQNAFMHSSEDLSLGYFTVVVDGQLYVCDVGNIDITNVSSVSGIKNVKILAIDDSNAADYEKKVSPIADLIHFITTNSKTDLTLDNLYLLLETYVANNEGAGAEVAARILDKENFESKGVTVEKLHASTEFDDWTKEERAEDTELLVSTIFGLLETFESFKESDGSGATDGVGEVVDGAMGTMLDQFVGIGETLDLMSQTHCINKLPPLILEGLVKNEMFSEIITPSIVAQINEKVQNDPDLSYADFMKSLADLFKVAIDNLS